MWSIGSMWYDTDSKTTTPLNICICWHRPTPLDCRSCAKFDPMCCALCALCLAFVEGPDASRTALCCAAYIFLHPPPPCTPMCSPPPPCAPTHTLGALQAGWLCGFNSILT